MNYRNIFIVGYTITIFLTGCSEAPVVPEKPAESAAADVPLLTVNQTEDPKISPTGDTFNVYVVHEELDKVMSPKKSEDVAEFLKAYFLRKGFKFTKDRNKSYSTIYVSGDSYKGGHGTETNVTCMEEKCTTVKKEIDYPVHYRLAVAFHVNQHGLRSKNLVRIDIDSIKPLDEVKDEIVHNLELKLSTVRFDVPSENTKMAGDPGCLPRFGFSIEEIFDNDKTIYKVTGVGKNSPAQKAGLRAGDLVEAIDSIPYADFKGDASDEIYNHRVTVPIKFSRNGKTVRGKIKPEVMCE